MKKLLAPNGKQSNLNEVQYHLVRTKAFKDWFGDWENDPENASKVIDENGEPLVVYHATDNEFNIFRHDKTFFSPQKSEISHYGSIVKSYFLNIKKLKKLEQKSWTFIKRGKKTEIADDYISFENDSIQNEFIHYINDSHDKYEGVLLKTYSTKNNELFIQFVVFNPEQIKLADGTNTTFDGSNPDIRFDKGGTIKNTFEYTIGGL